MVKILAQAGNSLADMYDVEGSIAGIDQLETRELPIVHEMGTTVFSERFSTFDRLTVSGAIVQSTDFNLTITGLPTSVTRLLGVQVLAENGLRIGDAAVFVTNQDQPREFPVWVWDQTNFLTILIDLGAGPVRSEILVASPALSVLPTFCGASAQPQTLADLSLRGATSAFGAGTVVIRLHAYIAFTEVGGAGVSSRGVPVPSW